MAEADLPNMSERTETRAIPEEFPELTDLFDGDAAGRDDVELEKVGDSVIIGGFHADLRTVMAEELVTAGNEVRVEGGESLFPIRGNALEVSSCDTDCNKFFVDVPTGTVVVNNTQHKKPPFKRSRH